MEKSKIKVTQVISQAGKEKSQRQTLLGLGLTRINRSKVLEDTPCIRGMVKKVAHLIKVEDVKG
jgi:large subunit ribosomal protein L30